MGIRLLNSPALILAEYIVEVLGKMTDPPSTTWPLYIKGIPDGNGIPHNAGAVYDTIGISDGRYMTSGVMVSHQGVQLRIRSSSYQAGYVKAEDIMRALDEVKNGTVSTATETYILQNVSRTTDVVCLGEEEGSQRRWHFTVNFLLTVKETEN